MNAFGFLALLSDQLPSGVRLRLLAGLSAAFSSAAVPLAAVLAVVAAVLWVAELGLHRLDLLQPPWPTSRSALSNGGDASAMLRLVPGSLAAAVLGPRKCSAQQRVLPPVPVHFPMTAEVSWSAPGQS